MGLKQERRVSLRELPGPLDQRVAVSSALDPPWSDPKARWLALVAGPFGVIAKFRSAGQRGVRVGFRDETATARRPAAAVGLSRAGQFGQAQELHARQPGRMGIRRIGADRPAAAPLPGLRLVDPLARHVADHERRVGEQDSITVSGCAVGPADGLLDAACPASVQDLAVPVDNRHAGLVGHRVGMAFPPGKVNTDEANSSHMAGCTAPLTWRGGRQGDRIRRSGGA